MNFSRFCHGNAALWSYAPIEADDTRRLDREAGAAVGAAVGAVVCDRVQNADANDTNNVERCTQRDNYQRVQEGYITTFSYNGHEFEEETQTKYRVGQKVPVQVNAVVDQPN